jgi:type IV secretion system protein TrbL
MEAIINLLAGSYLGALETGARALAVYALPILGIAAFIQFHREWWPVVLSGGGQMGEALGHFLFMIVTVGFYMWAISNLWDLGMAAFDTFVQWGLLGSGNGLSSAQLRNPGFIMHIGYQVAFPVAEQATWYERILAYASQAVNPREWVIVLGILVAFAGITVHHLFMLVEFYLALMCGHVLIGWGIWRTTAHFGEFALGWITGSLIRALVSCTMLGISLPLFETLRAAGVPAGEFKVLTHVEVFTPLVGSFIFAVLAWVLPARAARMASGATLGLTGSTVASAAMTTSRFTMMTAGAVRGMSQMLPTRP